VKSQIAVITLFPEMFTALTESGVSGRAIRNQLLQLDFYNPRDYTTDKHRTVDDRPYGGGPGMVMMVEPLQRTLASVSEQMSARAHVICLSPQGRPLDQSGVEALASYQHLVMICGRYEGIDERFIDSQVDEEWSIGDYVLSGGELAAMVILDAMIRTIPGALGHDDSSREDSFYNGLLDHPHYTRPELCNAGGVPEVLMSGDHAAIRRWRLKQSLGRTLLRRPDLLQGRELTDEEKNLLQAFKNEHNC
jgi:tRNA (guanine37-N1)-methyltransferase